MTKAEERVIRAAVRWVATIDNVGATSNQLNAVDTELHRAVKALRREREKR